MKRNPILILLLVAAILTSCNKDKTGPDDQLSGLTDLPPKAAVYIDENYPDADIDYVVALTNSQASFLVTLTTTEELAFDRSGEFLGDGVNFHNGSQECDTIYGHHPGGGHHGGGISVDSLSSKIRRYIAANYPGFRIGHAKIDTICPDGAVTEVVICMPDSLRLKLFFDAGDDYLMLAELMRYIAVPQSVKDYISTNYADSSVARKATKLTMADDSFQYWIYIRSAEIKTRVRMQEDGTFICDQSRTDTIPGGPHPGGPHGGGIPLELLSSVIKDYIAANYPRYEILYADFGRICPVGGIIEVVIGHPESGRIRLNFGPGDIFLMTSAPVPTRELPQAVKDYILANYSEYQVDKKSEKLTLSDGTLNYLVYLEKRHEKKRVRISGEGTLVCEQ